MQIKWVRIERRANGMWLAKEKQHDRTVLLQMRFIKHSRKGGLHQYLSAQIAQIGITKIHRINIL